MINAEKFITIWLDGDKEKAQSMIENNDWVEITAQRVEEILNILINSDNSINKIAIESKLIIEQIQKLLGVYTNTEALGKIAVLMREENEDVYKKFFEKIVAILNDDPETDVFARGVISAVRETYDEINPTQPQSVQYDMNICKHGKGHCQCDNTRCRNYCD